MKRAKQIKKTGFGKKYFPTFISSLSHQKHLLKKAFVFTLYIAVVLFLLSNIGLSQNVRPEYFQLMNNNVNAVLYYLHSVKQLPQYASEFSNFKNIYGKGLEESFLTEEGRKKNVIKNLEQVLKKNMYSRDILLGLFTLYNQEGNKKIAEEYLQRAKTVDPDIK